MTIVSCCLVDLCDHFTGFSRVVLSAKQGILQQEGAVGIEADAFPTEIDEGIGACATPQERFAVGDVQPGKVYRVVADAGVGRSR